MSPLPALDLNERNAPLAPCHIPDRPPSGNRPASFVSIMEEQGIQTASQLVQQSKDKPSSSALKPGVLYTIGKHQIAILAGKIYNKLIDCFTTAHSSSARICRLLATICKPGAVVWLPYLDILAQKKPLPNHLKPEIAGHAIIILSVDFETGNVLFSAITSREKYYNYLHHPISNFILCKNPNPHQKQTGVVHLLKYSTLLPDQIAEETGDVKTSYVTKGDVHLIHYSFLERLHLAVQKNKFPKVDEESLRMVREAAKIPEYMNPSNHGEVRRVMAAMMKDMKRL